MVYTTAPQARYARETHEGGETMDARTYVSNLLEDLAHITSGEERDAFDPTWLRGYVAGVATAAQYALEGEKESER